MKGVSVIGVGMIPFGKYPDTNITDLGWPAVKAAIKDAGIDARRIQAVYSGTARGGAMVGQRIMGRLGLAGLPIVNVENACSSSSSAMAQGVMAVASGAYDVVLVIGVEKLTKFGGGTLPLDEDDWEVRLGLTMPALYAMRAQRYMHDYGVSLKDIAGVSVKNRKNGTLNPDAQMRKEVSVDEVLASRMIADPFTLLQCCPTGDGAAAIILAANAVARELSSDPIEVRASHLTSGRFMSGFRDMTSPEITVQRRTRDLRGVRARAGRHRRRRGPRRVLDRGTHLLRGLRVLPAGRRGGVAQQRRHQHRRTDTDQSLGRAAREGPSGGRDGRRPGGRDRAAIARTGGRAPGRGRKSRHDARDRRRHLRFRSRRVLDPYFPEIIQGMSQCGSAV